MAVTVADASDYAVLKTDALDFYYGYELAHLARERGFGSDEWGFVVRSEGRVLIAVSFEALSRRPGCPDQYECLACLAFGVGLYLELVAPKAVAT